MFAPSTEVPASDNSSEDYPQVEEQSAENIEETEDNNGNIFVGTTAGVCYIDNYGRLTRISDNRLNDERIIKLDSDSNGVVYGQTKNGIVFSRDGDKIWKCRNCGHIVVGKYAPEVCPVCNHPQSYFEIASENY